MELLSKIIRAKRDPRFLMTRPKPARNRDSPFVPSKYSVLEEQEGGLPPEAGGGGNGGQVPSAGAFEGLSDSLPEQDPTQAELPSLGEFRKKMKKKQEKQLNLGGV